MIPRLKSVTCSLGTRIYESYVRNAKYILPKISNNLGKAYVKSEDTLSEFPFPSTYHHERSNSSNTKQREFFQDLVSPSPSPFFVWGAS